MMSRKLRNKRILIMIRVQRYEKLWLTMWVMFSQREYLVKRVERSGFVISKFRCFSSAHLDRLEMA